MRIAIIIIITALQIGSSYKYLGVLEAEGLQHNEVKSKVREIYKQKLRLVNQSLVDVIRLEL